MNDETIRLILDLANSAGSTQELVEKLQQLKVVTTAAGNQYAALEKETSEYELLERQIVATTQQVVQATNMEREAFAKLSFVTDTATVSTARLTGAVGKDGLGRGILQTSFAVQDFTSQLGTRGLAGALAAVQNNIPVILTGLGLGAGLAGIVSVVSVGVGLLVSNWGSIQKLWSGKDTEAEAERMKELAEQTERAVKAAEALVKTHTPEQREGTAAVKRATEAFGGQAVLEEIQKTLVRNRGSFGPEADREFARNLMQNANVGDVKAQAYLHEIMAGRQNPIAQVLAGGKTPEEERAIRARGIQREAKEADERQAQLEKEKTDRNKLADELTKEGAKNEEQMKEDQQKEREKDARERSAAAAKADTFMRQNLPKMKEDIQQRQGAKQIQQEAAAQGIDINQAQAVEIFKQRAAQAKSLQSQVLSQMIGNQDEMSQQIEQMQNFLRQARQVNQRNRSQQNFGNGGP